MALTIDKEQTALLAMDLENDIVHEEGAFKDFGFAQMVKQNDVLGKTTGLLDAARRAGVKVIYVSVKFRAGHPELNRSAGLFQAVVEANALVEGTWGATIHEAVAPKEGEPVITKRSVSAFAGSDLANLLSASEITTLLLCGVATNFVIEGTARDAVDRGYNVVIVGDCCASVSQEAHDSALTTALPFLTTITTLEETVDALS
ncbi:MAG: hydrolase [Planctomyces sp.]|jgi:nicotinamidase-related amidase|nr:hydrolase [Planctomyces sp.]